MTWRPSTKGNALEQFEVQCQVPFRFYGPLGEACKVRPNDDYSDMDNTITVECSPEDRARLIETLSALLDDMKRAEEQRSEPLGICRKCKAELKPEFSLCETCEGL